MDPLTSLLIDFESESKETEFGDQEWEDNSYNHMCEQVYQSNIDEKIKCEIIGIIDDVTVDLCEAYLKVVEYLYKKTDGCEEEEK